VTSRPGDPTGSDLDRSAKRAEWRRSVPLPLISGFALFLVLIGLIVIPPLTRRHVPTFEPTPPGAVGRIGSAWPTDTVTVDASDAASWRFVSLTRGEVLTPPDTAGWDLAARRFHIIAAEAVADLGAVAFEAVDRAPDAGYVRNGVGSDTTNAAIRRWYDYSMLTHLLKPKRHVYVVRTRDGGYAKFQILSYYCTGLKPGCLTMQYTYPLAGP
jgi:hypothetical protein